ncbi:hypothetical protein BS47DRAFT_1365316 [Hydnum rufescens UP504]|uniref:Ataxin-10 homolog n=1 Tax=Hydnum rufescens UP504 TaxID=1448309 RepID=A0A9P6AR20_9AGAM|nr:hypothetical protein BS47DRAFT_1365316 [Hydnum rufescens UP504]
MIAAIGDRLFSEESGRTWGRSAQCIRDFGEGRDIEGRNLIRNLSHTAQVLAKNAYLRSWFKVQGLTEPGISYPSDILLEIGLAFARFTRNLAAGVPKNQEKILQGEMEHSLRLLLHYFTSYFRSQEEEITGNDGLQTSMWNEYMALKDEKNILISWSQTLCDGSYRRRQGHSPMGLRQHADAVLSHQLVSEVAGIHVCICLLDEIVTLFDAEDDNAQVQSFDMGQVLAPTPLFECLRCVFEFSLAGSLWDALDIPEEIITPHRTTLLKLLDSYLQSAEVIDTACFAFLGGAMHEIVTYIRTSISSLLPNANEPQGGNPTLSPLSAAPDLKLPPLLEALVLFSQCSITLMLVDSEAELSSSSYSSSLKIRDSFVEDIIDVLRLLDVLLPRILWGKVQTLPHQTTPDTSKSSMDPVAFAYVKRDLVRMIGIVCHKDRGVQDRIRLCGGIYVVLNLCVVDERNPFSDLREHALFAVQSLLMDNGDNQAVVAELEPLGKWDLDGILRDTPGGIRR